MRNIEPRADRLHSIVTWRLEEENEEETKKREEALNRGEEKKKTRQQEDGERDKATEPVKN